jgi:hypothetical protein
MSEVEVHSLITASAAKHCCLHSTINSSHAPNAAALIIDAAAWQNCCAAHLCTGSQIEANTQLL